MNPMMVITAPADRPRFASTPRTSGLRRSLTWSPRSTGLSRCGWRLKTQRHNPHPRSDAANSFGATGMPALIEGRACACAHIRPAD
jgi:hypothetical protein